jgi:DNA-binding transcriptional regulator YiaG
MKKRTCKECGAVGSYERKAHELMVQVGRRLVSTRLVPFDRCSKCGYDEIPADAYAMVEMRAALAVLLEPRAEVGGSEFRFARKAMGLRQIDLAEALDVAPETISRWETEAATPAHHYRSALVGLLQSTITDIVGGDPLVEVRDLKPTGS